MNNDVTLRRELLHRGFADAEIRAALRTGRLVRLARGAYATAEATTDLEHDERYRLRVEAVARSTPGHVISHASAAAWHGLPVYGMDTARVHLTRPGHGGNAHSPDRVLHAGQVTGDMRTTVDGLAVTSAARTLVDVGRYEPPEPVVAAGDAALRAGLLTADDLAEALDAARHHTGRSRARRALMLLDGRSESAGESQLRVILLPAPLPTPTLQPNIHNEAGRFVGRCDLGYLDHGVLIEFDGLVKYLRLLRPGESVTDAVLREKRREERLTELGWLVLRFIWADLVRPGVVRDRVVRACASRRRVVEQGGLRGHVVPTPALF